MATSQTRKQGAGEGGTPDSKKTGLTIDPGPYVGVVTGHVAESRSGELWVVIPDFADASGKPLRVAYASPFYGTTAGTNTGQLPDSPATSGQSYGMWFVPPDIGNSVLVVFTGGDQGRDGYWFACIYDTPSHHMVPGISHNVGGATDLKNPSDALLSSINASSVLPVVEYDVSESGALASTALTTTPRYPHEYQASRLIVQGLDSDPIRGATSSSSLRESPSNVYGISTPGRKTTAGDQNSNNPEVVYARTGGHQFVMDDGTADGTDQGIRLRTTNGHQILMNDQENILYIATASGYQWIELGADGGISMYGIGGFNVRSKGPINMHSESAINMQAGLGGINMYTPGGLSVETGIDINMLSAGKSIFSAGASVSVEAIGWTNITSGAALSMSAIGGVAIDGATIALNGGKPSTPTPFPTHIPKLKPDTAFNGTNWAIGPSIDSICTVVPAHEPWPRPVGSSSTGTPSAPLGTQVSSVASDGTTITVKLNDGTTKTLSSGNQYQVTTPGGQPVTYTALQNGGYSITDQNTGQITTYDSTNTIIAVTSLAGAAAVVTVVAGTGSGSSSASKQAVTTGTVSTGTPVTTTTTVTIPANNAGQYVKSKSFNGAWTLNFGDSNTGADISQLTTTVGAGQAYQVGAEIYATTPSGIGLYYDLFAGDWPAASTFQPSACYDAQNKLTNIPSDAPVMTFAYAFGKQFNTPPSILGTTDSVSNNLAPLATSSNNTSNGLIINWEYVDLTIPGGYISPGTHSETLAYPNQELQVGNLLFVNIKTDNTYGHVELNTVKNTYSLIGPDGETIGQAQPNNGVLSTATFTTTNIVYTSTSTGTSVAKGPAVSISVAASSGTLVNNGSNSYSIYNVNESLDNSLNWTVEHQSSVALTITITTNNPSYAGSTFYVAEGWQYTNLSTYTSAYDGGRRVADPVTFDSTGAASFTIPTTLWFADGNPTVNNIMFAGFTGRAAADSIGNSLPTIAVTLYSSAAPNGQNSSTTTTNTVTTTNSSAGTATTPGTTAKNVTGVTLEGNTGTIGNKSGGKYYIDLDTYVDTDSVFGPFVQIIEYADGSGSFQGGQFNLSVSAKQNGNVMEYQMDVSGYTKPGKVYIMPTSSAQGTIGVISGNEGTSLACNIDFASSYYYTLVSATTPLSATVVDPTYPSSYTIAITKSTGVYGVDPLPSWTWTLNKSAVAPFTILFDILYQPADGSGVKNITGSALNFDAGAQTATYTLTSDTVGIGISGPGSIWLHNPFGYAVVNFSASGANGGQNLSGVQDSPAFTYTTSNTTDATSAQAAANSSVSYPTTYTSALTTYNGTAGTLYTWTFTLNKTPSTSFTLFADFNYAPGSNPLNGIVDAQINLNVTAGSPTFSYSFSNNTTDPTQALTPGNYWIGPQFLVAYGGNGGYNIACATPGGNQPVTITATSAGTSTSTTTTTTTVTDSTQLSTAHAQAHTIVGPSTVAVGEPFSVTITGLAGSTFTVSGSASASGTFGADGTYTFSNLIETVPGSLSFNVSWAILPDVQVYNLTVTP